MSKKYPSINAPDGTLAGATAAIQQLKQVVELLIGTRGELSVNRTFVQDTEPVAVRDGDFWVYPSGNWRIYVSKDGQWVACSALP